MHPTALKMAKSLNYDGALSDFKLPNSTYYLSTNGVSITSQLQTENANTIISVYTLDGSPVTGVTYSLTLPSIAEGDLLAVEDISLTDVWMVNLLFTPQDIYAGMGTLTINYPLAGGGIAEVNIAVNLDVTFNTSTLSVVTPSLDFGNINLNETAFANVAVHYAGITVDVSKLSYAIDAVVSTIPSSSITPVFMPTMAGVDSANGVINVTMGATVAFSSTFTSNLQLYYNGKPISPGNVSMSVANTGTTAPDPVIPVTPLPAPVGAQSLFATFKNVSTSACRVDTFSFVGDTLNEFAVSYPETLTGYILQPNVLLVVMVSYNPQQANLVAPRLTLDVTYF